MWSPFGPPQFARNQKLHNWPLLTVQEAKTQRVSTHKLFRTCYATFGAPQFGVSRRGSPGFVPICSDFPVLFRFVPNLRSLCLGMPRFVPICSVFFRFVFRTHQNKSRKPLSADPFAKSPTHKLSGFTTTGAGTFRRVRAQKVKFLALFES